MKMNCSRSIGAAQLFIIHYSLFIMNFVLDLYGHGSFHGGGEVLRREEGAFGLFGAPELHTVVHADEADRMVDGAGLEQAARHEEAAGSIEREYFHIGHELPEEHGLAGIPAVEGAAELLHFSLPDGVGIDNEAGLVHIALEHQARVGFRQLAAEIGRKKHAAFCVEFGFDCTCEPHSRQK